jgi:hypothetical protein
MSLVVRDLSLLPAPAGHCIRRLDYKAGPEGHSARFSWVLGPLRAIVWFPRLLSVRFPANRRVMPLSK